MGKNTKPKKQSEKKKSSKDDGAASTSKQTKVDETEASNDKTDAEQTQDLEFTQKPSLISDAKWYQKIWFSWVFPIIEKAGKKKLTVEDLGGLNEEDRIEKKVEMVEKVYAAQENKNILFACLIAFKEQYARSVITQIFQCALEMYLPYVLKEIVTLLVSKDDDPDINYKIIQWSVFIVVIRFCRYLIDEHDFYHNLKTGCATAQIIKSMIFKKQLKLTPSTSKNYEQGQIDGVKGCAGRFTWFSWEMSDFIKTPIVFIFVLYRLTMLMGWAFVPSLMLMIVCIQIDRRLDKYLIPIHKARDKINEKLGNNITNTLNNIKALKLYSWDDHFKQEIIKKKEESTKYQMTCEAWYCCYTLMWIFLPCMMNGTAFAFYINQKYHLDLPLAMEIMGLIDAARGPLHHFQYLREQLADLRICLQRIKSYLSLEEIEIDKFIDRKAKADRESKYAVQIKNKNFSWGLKTQDIDDIFEKIYDEMKGTAGEKKYRTEEEQKEHEESLKKKAEEKKKQNKLDNIVALKGIDLKIKKGELVIIIGKVGSGKSSLLSTIIGDLLPVPQKQIDSYAGGEGYSKELSQEEVEAFQSDMIIQQHDKNFKSAVQVCGTISLAQQKPWIQNRTLRDNILYNLKMDHEKYVDTIQFCELERDIEIMKQGDHTVVGEKGVTLSGGQQARLGLARAVYQDKDIYLLDDPISALDAHVRMNIMRNVVNGMLKDKTRILVTHSIDFLHMADKIVMMDKGKITAQGTYDELMVSNETFRKLQEINNLNKDDCKNTELDNKEEGEEATSVDDNKENTNTDNIETQDKSQEGDSDAEKHKDLEYPSTLTSEEKLKLLDKFCEKKDNKDDKILMDEETESIVVNWRDYVHVMTNYYGNWFYFVIIWSMSAMSYTFYVQHQLIMGQWADSGAEAQSAEFWDYFLKIVVSLMGVTLINCIRQYFVVLIINNAIVLVHKKALESIMKAPINKFFDVTPTGTIMNRFNDDLYHFQHIVHHFTHLFYQVNHIVTIIYTVTQVNQYFLLIWPFSIGYCFYIYQFTIGSYKEIHRLNRSNDDRISNHYSETMSGNSTIRAFGSSNFQLSNDHNNINQNLLGQQVSFATWVWYSSQMKLSSSFIMIITIIMMVQKRTPQNVVLISVAFEWIMSLGDHMTGFIHSIGHLEHQMIAIKRCLKLFEIPQENLDQPRHKDESWPQKGSIEMKNFHLRYRDDTDLVLKNCSFKIEAGQKIGIVGRTGAGKSTLCNAFTRIVEKESGSILFDGVEIADINIKQVREAITIIPQEPTMYKGTLAYNLDPTGKISKEDILSVLKKAKLDEIILKKSKEQKEKEEEAKKELEKNAEKIAEERKNVVIVNDPTKTKPDKEYTEDEALLNFEINDNLSSGEKSLVQICRAILRKNKIILLDEATANIDIETEQMVQKLINEEFKDCTMLVIAHRLQTIIKSDKVMVMSFGKVAEFDSPQKLMKNPKSHFTKLVNDLQREDKKKIEEKQNKLLNSGEKSSESKSEKHEDKDQKSDKKSKA